MVAELRLVPTIALALTLGAGCSSASDQSGTGGQSSDEARRSRLATNPVEVLKKVHGCKIDAGVTVGQPDINGNRYASCSLPGHEDAVTARSVGVDPRTIKTEYQELMTPDDTHSVLLGSDFFVVVRVAEPGDLVQIDVAGIADAVGGSVVPLS